jgi:hypothetical protein
MPAMDLSHDSPTILGQLRKGQAETNARLEAIRVELLRLNSHLEQLAAALSASQRERPDAYPLGLHLSQIVVALRPRALAMWSQARNLPRGIQAPSRLSRPHPRGDSPQGLHSSSP